MSDALQLRIEKAVYGGDGLARLPAESSSQPHSGSGQRKTVFVPFTLPGELVLARIVDDKSSFAKASLAQVVEASPRRVTPLCPHFGVCGGCHYQHADYEEQLAMKSSILRETLERAGLRETLERAGLRETLERAGEGPWSYRNRIRMSFIRDALDLALGYRAGGAHRIVKVLDASGPGECPIAMPLLLSAAQRLLVAALESQAAYSLLHDCAEAEFFCNADESQLQISLFARAGAAPETAALAATFRELCGFVKEGITQLAGVGLYSPKRDGTANARVGKRASASPTFQQIANWGANTLTCSVGGLAYRVSRGAFFQTNRWTTGSLVELVIEGRRGALAWDLYAGVGLFSRALAKRFDHVVAVESASPANKDLAFNLADARATPIAATTVDFLRAQTGLQTRSKTSATQPSKRKSGHVANFQPTAKNASRATPYLIVVDPPRGGLGPEVCGLLGQIASPELAYVSCDPATLSRDLAALIESGYQLRQLHLVDMFPQTFHLEAVAVLGRR